MRYFLIFLPLIFAACAHTKRTELPLAKTALDNSDIEFLEHTGDGPFSNYLAMNIRYTPLESFRQELENHLKIKLKNRGEAHITVITPPEYNTVLKSGTTIQEINQIAKDMKIQSASFTPACVGRGQTKIGDKMEQTYYIVVESKDLLKIRRTIFEKYASNGGEPSLFDPEAFYPHITLGFTQKDLHESDGIRKGKNSCILGVRIF